MLILSIDIGIKNLAHCLFWVEQNELKIVEWGVLDLTCTPVHSCAGRLKTKACGRKATLSVGDDFFCKTHAPKPVPTPTSKEEAVALCATYGIDCEEREAVKRLAVFKRSQKAKALAKSASECGAVALSTELTRQYNPLFREHTIDVVLIENQIGPLAAKMKLVQGMVVQYWVQKGCNVEIVSACNKLKMLQLKDTTYAQRKKMSVLHTQRLITEYKMDAKEFQTHPKKDDLADTFLQGLWYVVEKLKYELLKPK